MFDPLCDRNTDLFLEVLYLKQMMQMKHIYWHIVNDKYSNLMFNYCHRSMMSLSMSLLCSLIFIYYSSVHGPTLSHLSEVAASRWWDVLCLHIRESQSLKAYKSFLKTILLCSGLCLVFFSFIPLFISDFLLFFSHIVFCEEFGSTQLFVNVL